LILENWCLSDYSLLSWLTYCWVTTDGCNYFPVNDVYLNIYYSNLIFRTLLRQNEDYSLDVRRCLIVLTVSYFFNKESVILDGIPANTSFRKATGNANFSLRNWSICSRHCNINAKSSSESSVYFEFLSEVKLTQFSLQKTSDAKSSNDTSPIFINYCPYLVSLLNILGVFNLAFSLSNNSRLFYTAYLLLIAHGAAKILGRSFTWTGDLIILFIWSSNSEKFSTNCFNVAIESTVWWTDKLLLTFRKFAPAKP